MTKRIALHLSCLLIFTVYPTISQAVNCPSGYIEYNGSCYKKLSCKNGGVQKADKCACKTGWSGTLCESTAKGYVNLGNGILACAAGYKKNSNGKCVSKPADKVGAYLTNGMNNKDISLKNTTNADVYGISTRDDVDVPVNNAYADRKDATATIKIVNQGNGDAHGMANDDANGANAYAYKGTAEGNIIIKNTGNGKVYGAVQDGNPNSGYYNAKTMRGGLAFGNITIAQYGDGGVLGCGNNAYAAGESAASGTVNLKNIGKGNAVGVSNNNASADSSGVAYGLITIKNKGDGQIIGSKSNNTYASNDFSGEIHGYIEIADTGNGNIIGSNSYNTHSYNSNGLNYGSITIKNKGNSQITGSKSSNVDANNSSGKTYGYINITKSGEGDIIGSKSYNTYSSSNNGLSYGSITIKNTGNGQVIGSNSYNIYSNNSSGENYGYIKITNKGNGNVIGSKGTNVYINSTSPTKTYGFINIANNGSGNVYGATGVNVNNSSSNIDNAVIDNTVGRIRINNAGNGSAYGIYSDNYYLYNAKGGTGYIEMINQSDGVVYGMYNAGDSITSSVNGNGKSIIKIINLGSGKGYGIDNLSTTDSWSCNASNVSEGTEKQSLIEMVNQSDGTVMGMRGRYQTINSGDIKIHNLGSGTAVGMYVTGVYNDYSDFFMDNKNYWHRNDGTITIDRDDYTYDQYTAKTSDDVTYHADSARDGLAIGVYVVSKAYFQNNGTINIKDAATAYGIYAESGATIENNGTIIIDGSYSHSNKIKLNGSPLFQNGLLSSKSLNTNSFGGTVVASGTSQFIVEGAISGDLAINNNVVENGFDTTYRVDGMIAAADVSGLNLQSQSALFEVTLENNTDAVMTMKSFDSVVDNSSLADFLQHNYASENNENLFTALKGAETIAQLNSNIDDLFGKNMLSRMAFEDLSMVREVNFDMNKNMFAQDGAFAFGGNVLPSNYDNGLGSIGRYSLNGYNNGKTSFGVGISIADVRTNDGNSDNSRFDRSFMMSAPFGYKTHGFELISAPKLGYANGTYDRDGFDNMSYDGKVEKRMYALMNEARYPFKFGGLKLTPSAEFNMIGYNIKGHEDEKEYSLRIKSQNHYSVEAGFGLMAEKEFKPIKNHKFSINGGLSVYHEFADPYSLDVAMNGMNGTYRLRDEKRSENRAVARFGFGYEFSKYFDVTANLITNIDREYRTDAGIDLKYHF